MGTPAYMAPEQRRGDSRSSGTLADLYAIGVILYQMLTGTPPDPRSGWPARLEANDRDRLPVDPRVSRELEAVCRQCLRHRAEDRYPDADALIQDLDRFLGGYAVVAFPTSRHEAPTSSPSTPPGGPGQAAVTTITQGDGSDSTRSWWPFRRNASQTRFSPRG